jgi:hypothetical protein
MTGFSFWQRWLLVVSLLISLFGILMTFLSGSIVFDLFNHLINPVFWKSSPIEDNAQRFQQFVYGVLGAVMAGWGVFMSFIAHYPFRNKEKWAWNCIVAGTIVWFVLDNSISLYQNVYLNAIGNTGLFILVMLPIVFTKKSFAK